MQNESGKLLPNRLLLPAVALLSFLALAGFSYAQAASVSVRLGDYLDVSQNSGLGLGNDDSAGGVLGDGQAYGGYRVLGQNYTVSSFLNFSSNEQEMAFATAKADFDAPAQNVVHRVALAYAAKFTPGIPYHLSTTNGSVAGRDTNDAYLTKNRDLDVKFLGDYYIITGFENGTATSMPSVTLSRPILAKQMKVGESVSVGGLTLNVTGIPLIGSGPLPLAYFELLDAAGNRLDYFSMSKASAVYSKFGIFLQVKDVFAGGGGISYAEVRVYTARIVLQDGSKLQFQGDDATTNLNQNAGWTAKLDFGTIIVAGEAQKTLNQIALVASAGDLRQGSGIGIIANPAYKSLNYTGLVEKIDPTDGVSKTFANFLIVPPGTAASCSDSDGADASVRGTSAQSTSGLPDTTYTDYCRNTAELVEYYCNGQSQAGSASSFVASRIYSCANGCANGACIQSGSTATSSGAAPSSANGCANGACSQQSENPTPTPYATITQSTCAPFLTVQADGYKRVVQGSGAGYAIKVSSAGASTQSVSVDAICPTPLQCEFSGLPTPFNLAPGQSQALTLNANTPGAPGKYSLALQVFGGGGSCIEERQLNLTVDANPVQPSASNEFFTATLSSDDAIVQPGESAFWTLVVQSRLEDRQFVSVMHGKGEGNRLEGSTFVNPDVFPLLAGEEKTVPIEVQIPPSTPGGVYDFILKVRGTNAQGRAYDVDLPVRLYVFSPTLSLQLLSAPASGECAIVKGGNATYLNYPIKNFGGIEGPFRVELNNGGAPFVSVDKSVLQIAKGETATLRVTASPGINAPASRNYYSIVLRYNDYAALRIDGCASVSEVRGLEALGLREIILPRGESTSIPFSVRNSGSVATEYSLDYNPQPIAGMFLEIAPKVFSLGVGQVLQGSVTFFPTVSAPLGATRDIPIAIHATNFSKPVTLRVKIVADNRTSFLSIRPTSLVAVEGAPTQTAIAVGNGGDDALQSVVLSVEGIPKAWVQVRPSAQDIAGRKSRDYLVTLSVPKGFVQGSAERQSIPSGLVAASGLESVRKDAELTIIRPVRKLDAKVAGIDEVKSADGRTVSVSVKIAITNAGNVREEDIDASVPYSAAFVAASSGRPTLDPGSAQFVTVSLSPTVDSPEQDVAIILRSAQGGQTTQTVRVPAMGKNPAGASSDNGLFLRVGAIVLLLIAIAALLNRRD